MNLAVVVGSGVEHGREKRGCFILFFYLSIYF